MGSHEEIILDVLNRLPVKSLLRFKCVSKHWNTLISEPYFKKKHLNIHAKNQNSQKLLIGQAYDAISLYFYSTSLSSSPFQLVKDIRGLDCPLGSKPLHGRVYCCCDGLFFIGIWYKAEEKPSILLLWNPSTRDSVILPSQSEVPQEGYTYGLGYDSTSDDYKILGIDRFDEVPDEILSLKSGSSWKKIEETSGRMSNVDMSARELSLAFVHGAFHWIGWEQERSIVSFNISDEIYGEIPLPRLPYTLRRAERGVSVLEERLCVYHNNKINFDLWVMKDYAVEKSWMKWFTLPSNGASIIIPIYRFSDDEVLLSCYCSKGTAVYRTSSNRIWPLEHDNMSSITIQDGLVYTESLISPYFGYQIVS